MVLIVDLWWDEQNEEHIARHSVSREEVEELVFHQPYYVARVTRNRYFLTGQTDSGRYLSVVLDREHGSQYYVVTARDAAPKERRIYLRHMNR